MNETASNGSRTWLLIVRIMMFALPIIFAWGAYYVKSEIQTTVSQNYLSNERFEEWQRWKYEPDSKQIKASLTEIKESLRDHDRGDNK